MTYELIQVTCKPLEYSPSAGKWFFQLINSDGFIHSTSQPLFATREEAEAAARAAA